MLSTRIWVRAQALTDCGNINFGLIPYHEHNFHLCSEKKELHAYITLFASFAAQKFVIYWLCNNLFWLEISATVKLKQRNIFFLSPYCEFMETLPHRIQRTRIISSVIRVLLVNCLSSFRSCETVRTLNVSTCHKVKCACHLLFCSHWSVFAKFKQKNPED